MLQTINDSLSVQLFYDHQKAKAVPVLLIWNGRSYQVNRVGLHHTFKQGSKLYHVFSVETQTLFFRLILDAQTLCWRVNQIADSEVG